MSQQPAEDAPLPEQVPSPQERALAQEQAERERERREGRGRLSSIDLLPDEAEPEVVWALEQLRERKLPQTAILGEFNERLADKGIPPISKSAWSRYAVRRAIQFRKHDEARKMSAELVAQLGPEGADEVTIMVAEMLKLAMFEKLEGGTLSEKGIQQLANALAQAAKAQKDSADSRRKKEEDEDRKKRVSDVVRKAGVSAETLAEINRALGVG